MNGLPRGLICALISLAAVSTAAATQRSTATPGFAGWPTDITARLEATIFLQSLDVELLTSDTEELALDRWCTVHGLLSGSEMRIDRVIDAEESPSEAQRRTLAVSGNERVRHRKIRALCGATVVLEADEWFLPASVSSQLDAQLENSNWPFDANVEALHFKRRILSDTLLWPQLPELQRSPSEKGGPATQAVQPLPAWVLKHHVLVMLPDGRPFAEIQENYTGSLLAFPCPTLPEIVVTAKRLRPAPRDASRQPM
jgi:hypothetical protein